MLIGWGPSLVIRLEAIASRLDAIALRLEAIANRLEAIALRLESIGIRLESIGIRLESIGIRLDRGNDVEVSWAYVASRNQRDHLPLAAAGPSSVSKPPLDVLQCMDLKVQRRRGSRGF